MPPFVRALLVLSLVAGVAACKKAPTSSTVAALVAPVGQVVGPTCTVDNDGARYLVRGFVRLPPEVKVENDKLTLELYEKLEADGRGAGRALTIDLVEGKHIEFDTADVRARFVVRGSGTEGRITGVRLRTAGGPVGLDTEVGVVLTQKVLTGFQSKEVTGCVLSVDEIVK